MKNQQLRKHLKKTWKTRLRYLQLSRKLKECGSNVYFDKNIEIQRFPKNVSINNNAVIKEGARICACNEAAIISIGKNTTIGFHTFIFASSKIEIGNDCLVAPFVYLVDSDHSIDKNELINQQPNISSPIHIGNDVWLGTGCKILKGVTIGNGAIIAAGAIVNADVAPYEIWGGVPAKKISARK